MTPQNVNESLNELCATVKRLALEPLVFNDAKGDLVHLSAITKFRLNESVLTVEFHPLVLGALRLEQKLKI